MTYYKNTNMKIRENDLTLKVKDYLLNLRVLLLIETPKGFVFESHEDGYYFAIGGRMKIGESTIEAAKRELFEEIKRDDIDLHLNGIIENFFVGEGNRCHEINFIYRGIIKDEIDLNELHSDHIGFVYIQPKDANKFDIKPKVIMAILNGKEDFYHLVNRDL